MSNNNENLRAKLRSKIAMKSSARRRTCYNRQEAKEALSKIDNKTREAATRLLQSGGSAMNEKIKAMASDILPALGKNKKK